MNSNAALRVLERSVSRTLSPSEISARQSAARRHLVYSALIHACLSLNQDTHRDIINDWRLEDSDISQLGLVSVPFDTLNLIACELLSRTLGDLADVPGFFRMRDCWRLDLDPRLWRRGVLLPVRNDRLQITALKVFRHTRDESPFVLRTRIGRLEAA